METIQQTMRGRAERLLQCHVGRRHKEYEEVCVDDLIGDIAAALITAGLEYHDEERIACPPDVSPELWDMLGRRTQIKIIR